MLRQRNKTILLLIYTVFINFTECWFTIHRSSSILTGLYKFFKSTLDQGQWTMAYLLGLTHWIATHGYLFRLKAFLGYLRFKGIPQLPEAPEATNRRRDKTYWKSSSKVEPGLTRSQEASHTGMEIGPMGLESSIAISELQSHARHPCQITNINPIWVSCDHIGKGHTVWMAYLSTQSQTENSHPRSQRGGRGGQPSAFGSVSRSTPIQDRSKYPSGSTPNIQRMRARSPIDQFPKNFHSYPVFSAVSNDPNESRL